MSEPEGSGTTEEQDIQEAMNIIDGYNKLNEKISSLEELIKTLQTEKPEGAPPPPEGQEGDQTPPPSTDDGTPPPQTPPITPSPVDEKREAEIKDLTTGVSELKEEMKTLTNTLTTMQTGRSHTFSLKKSEE